MTPKKSPAERGEEERKNRCYELHPSYRHANGHYERGRWPEPSILDE